MEEASQLADRVMIMDCGRIILGGAPQRLIREQMETYVLQVSGLAATPEIPAGVRHERQSDVDLFYADSEEPLRQIRDSLPRERVELRYTNLEDVFFKVTGRGLSE
jgi:ABC-type multidrug transport system ATPase subunit